MLSSENSANRVSTTLLSPDVPPLPQCLLLEPITLGNQKYTRSGELRRVLGVPLGRTSEEHSFGVGHLKPAPPVATEELKNFKESVQDASKKARDRGIMLRESIFKVDRYREALSSMKRQRTDLLSSERSGGVNLLKMSSQILQNRHDHPTQRLEDKAKTVVLGLKKRIRTSMLDARADGRTAAVPKQQIVMEKDMDMITAGGGGAVHIKEKIRRLTAGGGGWDKKMKRKRSVGVVGNRAINGDQDMKRAMHPKLSADIKWRPIDAQGLRSRALPGMNGINKLVGSFVPTNSGSRIALRNELEGVPPLRDRTSIVEERVIAKGNNKLNIQEENPAASPSSKIKGKVCRTPRTGSVSMLDSSPDGHPSSGALGGGEQPTNVNKISTLVVANSHKRPMSTGSSAHQMAQWVGQRPLKISRTRRANLVSPISNNDEAQISPQGLATLDLSSRTPYGTVGSLPVSSVDNNNQKFKMKLENVPSPVVSSKDEESGGGENNLKEKRADTGEVSVNADHNAGAFILPSRKNNILVKGETGKGVPCQGSIGRSLSSARPAITLTREKVENVPTTKPIQSVRRGSDKNRSKSGRPPSKKLMDRKTSIHVGHALNSGSSDITGELDDDREELLVAANSARNANNRACSGLFWKQMEYYFASTTSQDASYLKHQLNLAEELNESLSQMFGDEYNAVGVLMRKEVPAYPGGRQENHTNQEPVKPDSDLGGMFDKVPPLYQRVLSALIEGDESEELYHQYEGRSMSFQCASDDSHCGSCNHIDVEPKDLDRLESEVESEVDFQAQKHCLLDRISCNKSASSNTNSNRSVSSSLCNNEQWQADDGLSNSDAGVVTGISQNDPGLPHSSQVNVSATASFDCQYQMLSLDDRLLVELQSIGLYPEIIPHLAEGEEGINQDIMELQSGLFQQAGRMMRTLGKIDKSIHYVSDVERRNMEQVAMNQLIEMAYKKRMACRGNHSSKSVVRRVSKQVALAFAKRTLARCQKLEDTGRSCFSEPALQDIIFSAPPFNGGLKSIDCVGSRTASNRYNEARDHKAEPRNSATGAVFSTLERHDSQSDNLQRDSSDAQKTITQSSEQAFFKHEPILNMGKKREVPLDNVVGSAASKVTAVRMKGRRSDRDGDQNREMLTSNSVSGTSHPKAKPKQKTNYLSNSGNGLQSRFMEATHPTCPSTRGSRQSMANVSNILSREQGLPSPAMIPGDSSKEVEELVDFENTQLNEFGSIDLAVSNGLRGSQELNLFDFEEVGLPEDGLEEDFPMGLDIPMDDISNIPTY